MRYSESTKWALCYEASKPIVGQARDEALVTEHIAFNAVSARFFGGGATAEQLLDAAIRFVALRDFNVKNSRDARVIVMLTYGGAQ